MKFRTFTIITMICGMFTGTFAQSDFTLENYRQFLEDNQNLGGDELIARYTPLDSYYSRIEGSFSEGEFSYLDTVAAKYALTDSELGLLQSNNFVVSERLSYSCFRDALSDIYNKDLPVLVTTDAILHALHASYDRILIDLELTLLRPDLAQILNSLHSSYPQLVNTYQSDPVLQAPLRDVDLYITVAKSLLEEVELSPQYAGAAEVHAIWEAVQAEQFTCLPLFMERPRRLDFSQFTVRGHYTQEPELASYFKSMMWLGRIDFALANPPVEWELTREGLRRMNLGAMLLNELVDMADVRSVLNEMDGIIEFMVGESDNLTPTELADLVTTLNIGSAADLLDDTTFDTLQDSLKASQAYGQKILSMLIRGRDASNTDPVELPVSFRLMGQRFIIDSYVFSHVVYDRIVDEVGNKVMRMMPDPLDAIFALGNDDALPLLEDELNTYPYASNLESLRYLVDAYDDDFWDSSLYNVWLQAIRQLNPTGVQDSHPLFMKTAAWHQQKLNTQLASWTQLRHDNLLYAKQSYTGMAGCSFPHSYVEPYPAFYHQIAAFAVKAGTYFAQITSDTSITHYFTGLQDIMSRLEVIAQKELDRQTLSAEEVKFLQGMLFYGDGVCTVIFSGWYADLFYGSFGDAAGVDHLVADVHTQPTDEYGNIVGRILHVGVGEINLGVFLADAPSAGYQPMAFVGPVMSYYEEITWNFDRLTDERWAEQVWAGNLPARPDWVNTYLADSTGFAFEGGRKLPGVLYSRLSTEKPGNLPVDYSLSQNYPNPFNPSTTLRFELPQATAVRIIVYDILGREVASLVNQSLEPGIHYIKWNGRTSDGSGVPSGTYIGQLVTSDYTRAIKMLLIK
ncbi:MAG: DUF3160 domain-containing protein [Fidelibacterota bacterium]|nr:MAG: DUF3160 domain-containing protein [Candidatus Neomarinimicrobiota bacterium]